MGVKDASQQPHWHPSYLRRTSLLLFLLTFAVIIAALEILYHFSQERNGLTDSTEDYHYLWTYGPTAIFTVVAALWSRVEFQSKQNAPWQAMRRGPQPAETSVLLDYVSDMQPVAMWKAFRNKHWVVFSGVLCSLLFKVVIILSTGLFALREIPVRRTDIPIQLQDSFSTQNYTLRPTLTVPRDILNGVLFENASYPAGTNKDMVYQQFSATELPSDAVASTVIDGITAEVDCQRAKLNATHLYNVTQTIGGKLVGNSELVQNFHVDVPSCHFLQIPLLRNGPSAPEQVAMFQTSQCRDDRGFRLDSEDASRIIVSLLSVHESGNKYETSPPVSNAIGGSGVKWWGVDVVVDRSVVLVCKPKTSTFKLQATKNLTESSDLHLRKLDYGQDILPNVTSTMLYELVVKTNGTNDPDDHRAVEAFNPFPDDSDVDRAFKLGMRLTGIDGSLDDLYEDGVLEKAFTAYYRAVAAQFMHMGLVRKESSMTTGSATVNENRVVMLQLPLRGIETCLGIIILLTVPMLLLVASHRGLSWNPAHIASMAAITANGEEFRDHLRGLGGVSEKALEISTRSRHYSLGTSTKGTLIKFQRDHNSEDDPDESTEKDELVESKAATLWKPFPGLWARIILFTLVAAMVIVLEVLLHVSNTKSGLGDAHTSNEYMHYLWTIIPALAMSGIGLMFGSIDGTIRCLAPYARLTQKRGSTFGHAMNLTFMDSLGLTNIYRSIRTRHYAVLATTIATMAAFFLTIIVSGLYSTAHVPFHVDVNFRRVGSFPDPSALHHTDDPEYPGVVTSEYIIMYNLSFPSWTYDELAFGKVSMDETPSVDGSFVDIRLPAMRSSLTCNVQTAEDLKPTFHPSTGLNITLNTLFGAGNNSATFKHTTVLGGDTPDTFLFGQSNYIGNRSEVSSSDGQNQENSPQPAVSYIWGYLENRTLKHITAMVCIQYAETLDAWTRLKLPDMEIDPDYPPIPDESSAQLAGSLRTPTPSWTDLESNDTYTGLDNFFELLVSGRYAIPLDTFKNERGNQDVMDAIKHQHKLINAQQYNNYTRGTSDNSIEHDSIIGNVTVSDRQRVIQGAISTRILDALLGCMLILGIVGSLILDTDRVLPKNPCSIAAVSSLLADSKLLDEFVKGDWKPEDEDFSRAFAYRRFFLHWWPLEDSGTTGADKVFKIDHAAVDKET